MQGRPNPNQLKWMCMLIGGVTIAFTGTAYVLTKGVEFLVIAVIVLCFMLALPWAE